MTEQPTPEPTDPERRGILAAMQRRPADAARAGVFAPLIGIALMLILGLAVDPWVGVAVGLAATLIALPAIMWFLAKRAPPPPPPETDDQ